MISEIREQNNLAGVDSLTSLADKSINKRGWSAVLLDAYNNRKLPTFISELITRINFAHQQEMMQVNSMRTKLINRLENEINSKRKSQNVTTHDSCQKQTEICRAFYAYEAALADNVDEKDIVKLGSHYRSLLK